MRGAESLPGMNALIVEPESDGTMVNEGFVVRLPVSDFELLLCHGTACAIRMRRDLNLPWAKVQFIQQNHDNGQILAYYHFIFGINNALTS